MSSVVNILPSSAKVKVGGQVCSVGLAFMSPRGLVCMSVYEPRMILPLTVNGIVLTQTVRLEAWRFRISFELEYCIIRFDRKRHNQVKLSTTLQRRK